jgi:hypothetical protein
MYHQHVYCYPPDKLLIHCQLKVLFFKLSRINTCFKTHACFTNLISAMHWVYKTALKVEAALKVQQC